MTRLVVSAALGLGLFAFPWVSRAWKRYRSRIPRWTLEISGPVALVCATAAVYWPLVCGHPPTNGDHGFVLYKALEQAQLLHRHELIGWTDMEFAGFPMNANYPLGGPMVTLLLHALPFVSLTRAYAWSVWLAMFAMVAACYLAGRLHFGYGVGLAAGLLALFDPGDWWVGGHFSTLVVGMWIQTLSTGLCIAGIALWPWAVRRGQVRWLVATGALIGAATLVHPQALLLAGIAGLVMLVAMLSSPGYPWRSVVVGSAWIASTAFFTCAFWLIQYAAARRFSDFPTNPPPSSNDMWKAFTDGTILHGPGLWCGVALMGVLMLARRREAFARFLALAVPTLAIVFTDQGLELLHLKSKFTDGLQLVRIYYLLRPLALIAAACALAPALAGAARWAGGRRGDRWTFATRALVALLAYLCLRMPGVNIPGMPADAVPQGYNASDAAALDRALKDAGSRVKPGERVGLHVPDDADHSLVFPAAALGLKVFQLNWDAACMFKNRFRTTSLELLSRDAVTVLVSKGELPAELAKLAVVGVFGPFQERLIPPKPRAWMEGPGQVSVESWQDEAIRLSVTGAGPKSRIRLGLAYYDAWRTDDGTAIAPFKLREATLSELPARDGEVVLRYHAPRAGWFGWLISLAGFAALALVANWRRLRGAPVQGVAVAPGGFTQSEQPHA